MGLHQFQQESAFLGDLHLPAGAAQKRGAQGTFQRPDLLPDGRHRQAELLGGGGETSLGGSQTKGAELRELNLLVRVLAWHGHYSARFRAWLPAIFSRSAPIAARQNGSTAPAKPTEAKRRTSPANKKPRPRRKK